MATAVFACGFEEGVVTLPGHWTSVAGSPSIQSAIVRRGGFALRTTPSAGSSRLQQNVAGAATIGVARFFVQLVSLPAGNVVTLAKPIQTAGANDVAFGFDVATAKFAIADSANAGRQLSAQAAVAGRWYRIDIRVNVVANPWVIDWQIDGQAQTQSQPADAATTVTGTAYGTNAGETFDAVWDDILFSSTTGDYPLGDGYVLGFVPQSVTGTHNQTAGDLQTDASANVTNGDSTGSKVAEIPADLTSFIKQVVIRTTSYYEAIYSVAGAISAPRAVQQIVGTSLVSGTTGTQKAQLFDGTTATDTYSTVTPGATTLVWFQKCWAAAPTGAWTQALLAACRIRWGFAGVVTGSPFLTFTMLEAEFPAPPVSDYPYIPVMVPLLAQ